MPPPADVILGVDLGTSHVCAALNRAGDITPVPMGAPGEVESSPAVWLDPDGSLLVGRDAEAHAASAPDRFDPAPRLAIDVGGPVRLGGVQVSAANALAVILRSVYSEALVPLSVAPVSTRLGYPAEWDADRQAVLRDAALRASMPRPVLVADCVAIALLAAADGVAEGGVVAVLDMGASAAHAAAVRRTAQGFEVVGIPAGAPAAGGLRLDDRLVEHLIAAAPTLGALRHPSNPDQARAALELRGAARRAKEALSSSAVAKVELPGISAPVDLTREKLDELAREGVDAAAAALVASVASAGVEHVELAAILLAGGGARLPLVAEIVESRFGRRPDVVGTKEGPVAAGATLWREPGPSVTWSFRSKPAHPTRDASLETIPPARKAPGPASARENTAPVPAPPAPPGPAPMPPGPFPAPPGPGPMPGMFPTPPFPGPAPMPPGVFPAPQPSTVPVAPWVLAVDFGTTFTVAAALQKGQSRLIDVEGDGSNRTSSAVLLLPDGDISVGRMAVNQAVLHPDRFEPTPKRLIGEGRILLGDRPVAVTELVAAVLRRVYDEACRQHSGVPPIEARLTHPAGWATARTSLLLDAARLAGMTSTRLLPEPVAAAARIGAARVGIGEHVAVYDFGGGTFDAAVLRRSRDGFSVAGKPGGRDPLGGEDIDQSIVDHLGGGEIGEHPDWPKLVNPPDEAWRRRAADLRKEVRRVKEDLSQVMAESVWIPGIERSVQLTRAELEALIAADIEATVDTLEETIAAAGLSAPELAGIFLVGGSSRIPLVSDRVWERLARKPDSYDDPKAVVALGAAEWVLGGGGPAGAPQRPPFGGAFSVRPATATWPHGGTVTGHLLLQGPGMTVSLSDEVAVDRDARGLAERVAQAWRGQPGYRELGMTERPVLGVDGGLERRFECSDGEGQQAIWLHRYVVSGGRAIVVTAPEAGRPVADLVELAVPSRAPAAPYALLVPQAPGPPPPYVLPFTVAVPDGWTASERVVLVRAGSLSPITAENMPVPFGTTSTGMAHQAIAANHGGPAWRIAVKEHSRALGYTEATIVTARSLTNGDVTRTWLLAFGDRGFRVAATVPARERLVVGQLIGHFGFRTA